MQKERAVKKQAQLNKALCIHPLSNDNETDSATEAYSNFEKYQQALRAELRSAQNNVAKTKDSDTDCVTCASADSFPASDPPSWTNVSASTRV